MSALSNNELRKDQKFDSGNGNGNVNESKNEFQKAEESYQLIDDHLTKNFRSVSTKLLILILIFTMVATIISTALQVYNEYQRNLKLIDEEMDQIKNSYLQPLALTIWDVDKDKLSIQLQGILALSDVEEVRLENKSEMGEEVVFGKIISSDTVSRRFPVIYLNPSKNGDINELGTLVVTVGLDKIKVRMTNMGVRVLCVEAIKIFLITLFIFLIFQTLVTKHLKRMAEYTQNLNSVESLKSKLVLDRDDGITDEFTLVTESTNKLTDRLHDYAINLRLMIDEKTKDIKTILDNIQQGIFTILPNNKIHSEYSKYLQNILETENIAGQDILDALFKNSDLTPEMLSKIFGALIASLGEDLSNFEKNKEHFVREYRKEMKDGSIKVLELDWNPIADQKNIIEKIMVTVRNVTDIRKLQAEAHKKQRELEIIAEILSISPEKFNNFLNICRQLLSENKKYLKSLDYQMVENGEQKRSDRSDNGYNFLNVLLSNLHTLKGAARSHGLFGLSAATHDTEHALIDYRNSLNKDRDRDRDRDRDKEKDINKKIDSFFLLKHHKKLQGIVEDYIEINDKKLGRHSSNFYHNTSNKQLVSVEYKDVQTSMDLLKQLNSKNLSPEQRIHLQKIYKFLALIGTAKLKNILSTSLAIVPDLAKELGKAVPKLYINDKGIYIKGQIHLPLQNLFTHLFRNSVDHGIERASERLAKGKEAYGLLEFDLHVGKFHFMIRYRDDGRGLNIDLIRKIALEKEIISNEVELTKDEICNLIFDPRISTATNITEISGRGMGLDAVKKILEDISGDIKAQLINAPMKDEGYYPFELVITLPRDTIVLKEEIEKIDGQQFAKLAVVDDKDDKIEKEA
ncbi:MAG: hypothetical protein HQK49_03485 [Oligoflexia bacterium]|nr:hypothetical protein [Oligoflexia bacterium]